MSKKTELQKVSAETMRFMRGKYVLDEVPGKYYEVDCLKFRQGKKPAIELRSISADDVTWAILPYVQGQYGN